MDEYGDLIFLYLNSLTDKNKILLRVSGPIALTEDCTLKVLLVLLGNYLSRCSAAKGAELDSAAAAAFCSCVA